jgi:catechol 2,3-dioxygenase-like lactoylglutathione lyase family enzyme
MIRTRKGYAMSSPLLDGRIGRSVHCQPKEAEMTKSLQSVGAITMFVQDPKRSKAFYERVFEVVPVYEDANAVAFEFENTIVNLLRTSEAHDLIGPATVAAADAGSRFQLTIWVEDTDGVCEELAVRGVELVNGPIDRDWGLRTAAFADPDGHIWEVAAHIEA